ncbi:TetR/AcrR family transcriptional regulator [Gordonia terrae]
MPRLVDHDERRRAIVAAAWRLLATRGVDGISMRDLAAEAGYTNGALSHYFAGKDEILRTAYEYVIEATNARIASATRRRSGRAALRALCRELMPMTDEATLEARIAMSLWQRAMTDSVMAEVNNAAVAEWKSQMTQLWNEAVDAGELPACDIGVGVELLMTTIFGLQVTAVLDPVTTAPADQIRLMDAILDGSS